MKRIFLCLFVILLVAGVSAFSYTISDSEIPTGGYSIISQTGNESYYQVGMEKVMMEFNEKTGLWETILIWMGIIEPKKLYREDTKICIKSNVASINDYAIPSTLDLYKSNLAVTSSTLNREHIKKETNIKPTFEKGDTYQFCYQANPEIDFYLKFGTESIIIVGDATYNATTINVTLESGFAHLTKDTGFPYNHLTNYFPFDENSSNLVIGNKKVYDYVRDNDGYLVNGAILNASCLYDDCLSLPQTATADYFNTINPIGISSGAVSANLSLCVWKYWTEEKSDFSFGTSDEGYGLNINGSQVAFKSTATNFLNFSIALQPNTWEHLCWVEESSGGNNLSLYYNGVYNSSVTCNVSIDSQTDCEDTGCSFTSWKCLGTYDCNSAPDEPTCLLTPNLCLWDEFTCNNVGDGDCSLLDEPTCTEGSGGLGCFQEAQACVMPTLKNGEYQYIGKFSDSYFAGLVDEVMFFNKTLNGTEISNIFNNVSNRFENTGEFTFKDINFSDSTITNINLQNCNNLFDGNISATIGNGSEVNLTNCAFSNYDLPDASNNQWQNLTIRLYSGNSSNFFYTPLVLGNITLDDWAVDVLAPYWITIPEPVILNYDVGLSVDFVAGDDFGIDAYMVNSTEFSFNSSGTLINASTLAVGIYYLNVSVNDTSGQSNDTEYNVTINQGTPSLILSALPSWNVAGGTMTTITGSNCPLQLTCDLFRSDLSVLNPDIQTLGVGSYPYVYNTTGNSNYTSAETTNTLNVGTPEGLGEVSLKCPEQHFGYYNPHLPRINRGECNG